MRIYAMSDIHGCLNEFLSNLDAIDLASADTKLILLGDYVHRGHYNKEVLDKVIELQNTYGNDKVIALMGNHEDFILRGEASINKLYSFYTDVHDLFDVVDDKYLKGISSLPKYHVENNLIFVHAGINENAGALWEKNTTLDCFVHKYPAELGKIEALDKIIVAGHVGVNNFSTLKSKQNIVYDGQNHIYIDGEVYMSGILPIFMADTNSKKHYEIINNMPIELQVNVEI